MTNNIAREIKMLTFSYLLIALLLLLPMVPQGTDNIGNNCSYNNLLQKMLPTTILI